MPSPSPHAGPVDTPALLQLATARWLSQKSRGRDLRLKAGLSLGEVASVIGVGENTISRWENGRRRPHGEPAILWADLCSQLKRHLDGRDEAA